VSVVELCVLRSVTVRCCDSQSRRPVYSAVSFHPYVKADQIKDSEVGGACGTHGRGEKRVQGFDAKARRKKTT
jgi:hypothetical protein